MQSDTALNDCFLHDKDRMRHQEALALLKARIRPVADVEPVTLAKAQGRILASAVTAPRDIPAADNSAVDGYAFRHADHDEAGGFFKLDQRIAAGSAPTEVLGPWSAARIFTGAVMPPGADTVAMQEDCERHSQDGKDFVIVPQGLKPGANCRKAGEDVAEGAAILEPGMPLRPQDVAAIASTGTSTVDVFRRLKVTILSTGDELLRPGEPMRPGAVYDANSHLLNGLCRSLPVDITDAGILPDNRQQVEEALGKAASQSDVILTTGGASRGEEDHILTALDTLGSRHMWQLAIKPGRPMMFGRIGECTFAGLPGNPVAAMVCFLLYVRPMLSVLGGGPFLEPQRFQIPADFAVPKKKPDRREFYRGILGTDPSGNTVARKFARDGSGLITGLREADGLIEIPEEATSVEQGAPVTFLPFSGLGII